MILGMINQGKIWIQKYLPYLSDYEAHIYRYDEKSKTMIVLKEGDPIFEHTGFSDALSNAPLIVSSEPIYVSTSHYRKIIFAPYSPVVEGYWVREDQLFYQNQQTGELKKVREHND